eukprot:8930723-Alexandrium_andersonii.AAC.1
MQPPWGLLGTGGRRVAEWVPLRSCQEAARATKRLPERGLRASVEAPGTCCRGEMALPLRQKGVA